MVHSAGPYTHMNFAAGMHRMASRTTLEVAQAASRLASRTTAAAWNPERRLT